MKALVKTILMGLILTTGMMAQGTTSPRTPPQGLPLPWPFPWAKECPVDWQRMAGRYVLSDSADQEQIELKITVVTSHGFRLVRLSRFDHNGHLIADGFSFVSLNQRMLRLKLMPRALYDMPTWALIKLHYSDWNLGCAEDHLVPILTLEPANSTSNFTNQYRLVRVVPGDG